MDIGAGMAIRTNGKTVTGRNTMTMSIGLVPSGVRVIMESGNFRKATGGRTEYFSNRKWQL